MINPQKILIISNSGIGLYSFRRELIEELLKEGLEVVLAYPGNERNKEFISLGSRCINVQFDSSSTNPISDIKLFFKLYFLIKNEKPNIVLLYTIKPSIYAGIACRFLGIPCISTVTGISPALISEKKIVKAISIFLARIGYANSKFIYFQNKMNLELYKKYKIGVNTHKLVNGSGVNLDQYKYLSYPYNNGKTNFLYIGRIIKIKGVEELLIAFEKLKNKYNDAFLRIIGWQEDKIPLFDKLVDSGVIEYLGESNNVIEHLKWCNALILPSYGEGMSNVLQEASASGRPVVASDIPGCKEIIDNEKTGFCFLPKNAESLFETMQKFYLLDYNIKKQMGENARKKMELQFDRRIIVNTYIEDIHRIIGK